MSKSKSKRKVKLKSEGGICFEATTTSETNIGLSPTIEYESSTTKGFKKPCWLDKKFMKKVKERTALLRVNLYVFLS